MNERRMIVRPDDIEVHLREVGYSHYRDYIRFADKHSTIGKFVAESVRRFRTARTPLRVLDVGAGSGWICAAVLEVARDESIPLELTAVEPCGSARVALEQQCARLVSDERMLEVQPVAFEAFCSSGARPFDLVIASHVSYHFDDLGRFVAQLANSLATQGEAVIIAASTRCMQNPLYREMFSNLRADQSHPRTFATDGRMTFAENVLLALVDENIPFTASREPSSVTFDAEAIKQSLDDLNAGVPGPVLKAMAFLWRFEPSVLLTRTAEWRALFEALLSQGELLRLDYEDVIMHIARAELPFPSAAR